MPKINFLREKSTFRLLKTSACLVALLAAVVVYDL